MTTSQGTETPAERTAAEGEIAPVPAQSGAVERADTREAAPPSGGGAAAPANARLLEEEIRRTREQLGETVEELVARVDVKSRARAKAAELSGRVKGSTAHVRDNAAARAEGVRTQVADTTKAARKQAISAGGAAKTRVASVGTRAQQATPEPVRRAVTKGAKGAREQWIPLTVAAGALTIAYLVFSELRRRQNATACC